MEEVKQTPRILILPTGSGTLLEESSKNLAGAIAELGVTPQVNSIVPDFPKILFAVLERAFQNYDFILVTADPVGGPFDVLKGILEKLKVQMLFWEKGEGKKPPFFCGKWKGTFIFGIPANSDSARRTCFEEYVRPAIRRWIGR